MAFSLGGLFKKVANVALPVINPFTPVNFLLGQNAGPVASLLTGGGIDKAIGNVVSPGQLAQTPPPSTPYYPSLYAGGLPANWGMQGALSQAAGPSQPDPMRWAQWYTPQQVGALLSAAGSNPGSGPSALAANAFMARLSSLGGGSGTV